ncbi:hypothetical protein TRFO_40168 [Tritrichomonas foetus]|uniref:Intimal thickness related receptor IRP domain-containing protein n=1 Tax=Tritrichomonas foetus TaxID=1144522 RepID=A0A1J4J4C2_9EUKA|nr:hypothetical protein TRFO_40168 [Tritrichomonas foetus]|eukprot:OHS93577.1 hypothetical protein TRFO_40168 [Tritrichomonas foetus]
MSSKIQITIQNFIPIQFYSFMFFSFFFLSFRGNYNIPSSVEALHITDYGFYQKGTYSLTFANNLSNIPYVHFQALLLDPKQYTNLAKAYSFQLFNITECNYSDYYVSNEITFSNSTSNFYTMSGSVTKKGVFYFVILNCDVKYSENENPKMISYTNLKSDNNNNNLNDIKSGNKNEGKYFLNAVLMNPNDQHLDYRLIPDLKALPILIGLFTLLLVSYIAILIYFHRKFLRIHIFLIVSCVLYIMYLSFYYTSLIHDENYDWKITLSVFKYLYHSFLFITLLIASSGWCILHVPISWVRNIIGMIAVCVYWLPSLLMEFIDTTSSSRLLFLFSMMLLSLTALVFVIYGNMRDSQMHLNAHLYVIQQDGINPMSTPIFRKKFIIVAIVELPILSLLFIYLVQIITSYTGADQWISDIVNFIVQLLIILSAMLIYRPQGKDIDQYINADEGDESDRGQVRLEDLNQLQFDQDDGQEWTTDVKLPLEPILIKEQASKTPLKSVETEYTRIRQPLIDEQ